MKGHNKNVRHGLVRMAMDATSTTTTATPKTGAKKDSLNYLAPLFNHKKTPNPG
jgi:hypothetical protein